MSTKQTKQTKQTKHTQQTQQTKQFGSMIPPAFDTPSGNITPEMAARVVELVQNHVESCFWTCSLRKDHYPKLVVRAERISF
jgi:hypothetical protein